MNHQQAQRSFSANGGGRRRSERDAANRLDTAYRSDAPNWRSSSQTKSSTNTSGIGPAHVPQSYSNSNSTSPTSSGRPTEDNDTGDRGSNFDHPLHDRLLFLTMCLIGQFVEVQVKNGSVYSGIFHTANAEKDFGVVLKMARLIKDGSVKGGKSEAVKDAARKAPLKTFIIYAKDFVQIIAKDVSLAGDGLSNGRARENRSDLVTDSVISQARSRDVERELKPWKPDSEAPKNLSLESTFQSTWNRNWDQFETNKALFGVESTFNEELYTTKLEKGPQTREREREAWRIAREIEGQSTRNLHLAEERGLELDPELEHDEESRFSSVIRDRNGIDAGHDDESKSIDGSNEDTFGESLASAGPSSTQSDSNVSTPSIGEAEEKISRFTTAEAMQSPVEAHSPSGDSERGFLHMVPGVASVSEEYRDFQEFKPPENTKKTQKKEEQAKDLKSLSEGLPERAMKDLDIHSLRATAERWCPSSADGSLESPEMLDTSGGITSPSAAAPPASALPIPTVLNSLTGAMGQNTGQSRSSRQLTSTAAKKSLLNPNAKEFKLNPNAKVFTPVFTAPRPASPINQSPIFMPGLQAVTPMQGVPVGLNLNQTIQQPGQFAQFTQYNSSMAAAAAAVSSAPPYLTPPAAFLPGVPGTGIPAVLPAQATVKLPPQTQAQVAAPPYSPQQTMRYLPQGPPLQPAPTYPHHSGQLYPQPLVYGQPGQILYFHQVPQGIMQGQPIPLHQQGPLPPQPTPQLTQQHKHRSTVETLHYNTVPNFLVGQQLPQSLHASLAIPGATPQSFVSVSGATIQDGGNGRSGRVGGKNVIFPQLF